MFQLKSQIIQIIIKKIRKIKIIMITETSTPAIITTISIIMSINRIHSKNINI